MFGAIIFRGTTPAFYLVLKRHSVISIALRSTPDRNRPFRYSISRLSPLLDKLWSYPGLTSASELKALKH